MTGVHQEEPTQYYRLLNLRIRLIAPDPRILRRLGDLLGSFQCKPLTSVTHEIKLRYSRSSGRVPAMDILINQHPSHRSVPAREIIPYLEWVFNDLVVQTNESGEQYCLIHAAVVARGKKGILLCGDAGCGKSSLSLALMQRRYRYLTDEIACWDARRENVIAYPKAITLKEYGYRRFRRARIRLPTRTWHTKAFKGRVWYINPMKISPRWTNRPARIGLVIFPAYQAHEEVRVRHLPKAQAIVLLHEQRFDGNGFAGRDFDALTALVRKAPVFHLRYGDVLEAAGVIDHLARKRSCT